MTILPRQNSPRPVWDERPHPEDDPTSFHNEDFLTRLKRLIGYSEEPVQDRQGYWTIGYGRRLNDTPGGPKPYATVSEPIAHDELSYFMDQGGDPSTRLPSPKMPTVDEAVTSALGKDPGINYHGTNVRFTGDVPREDIDATFQYLNEQPPPNPLLGIGADVMRGFQKGMNATPLLGDYLERRRKEEEERLQKTPPVAVGTRW